MAAWSQGSERGCRAPSSGPGPALCKSSVYDAKRHRGHPADSDPSTLFADTSPGVLLMPRRGQTLSQSPRWSVQRCL